ncbi:MAG: hypothetical protein ACHQX3_00205 [Nitrospirales bacterium]
MTTFGFLYATRFWALVIGALALYAKNKGWIGSAEMEMIATITAGFIGIRTVDRATEQKVLATAVSTGEVKAATILKIPPSQTDTLGEAVPTGREIV